MNLAPSRLGTLLDYCQKYCLVMLLSPTQQGSQELDNAHDDDTNMVARTRGATNAAAIASLLREVGGASTVGLSVVVGLFSYVQADPGLKVSDFKF